MPSGRERIRMSPEEVDAFLADSRTMSVATLGPDGWPHLVAMWYVLLDGAVHFWTYGRSRKAVNLRRDPRLTCMVEDGDRYDELRGVQLRGQATLLERPDEVLRVGAALFERYTGPATDEVRVGLAANASKRVAVRVEVDGTASWDHRKLAGTS